jgi:hypothetical protein
MDEFRAVILFVAEAVQFTIVVLATVLLGFLFSNFAFVFGADRLAGFAIGAVLGFSISALFVHMSVCLGQILRANEQNTQLLAQVSRELGLIRVQTRGCWQELLKQNKAIDDLNPLEG